METMQKNLLRVTMAGVCLTLCASVAMGQSLQADIDISPSVLNLGSKGTWISCSIRLPDPHSASDIDTDAIRLNGRLIVVHTSNSKGRNVLSVKFSRSDVQDILGPVASGDVELDISGELTGGATFEGTDTITIKHGTLTITPSAGPHGSISPNDPVTVPYGGSQTFTADPDTGYEVDTWSLDGSVVQTGGGTYTVANVQADHTIRVTFKQLQYQVTPSAGPHGSISPDGPVTVPYGGSRKFTADPDTGYEVDAWSLDGSVVQTGGSTYTVGNVQADQTIRVTFKQLQYQVTPAAGPHGSISPDGPVTVPYGGSRKFTADPDTGYEVDAWSLDGSIVQTGGTMYTVRDVQADQTIRVTFRAAQYTITPTAGPYGSIDPSAPLEVEPGSDLKFTAYPATGYKVDTWLLDNNTAQIGGDEYELLDIDEDHTVHVTFIPLLSYSLGDFDFDEAEDFAMKVVTNNVVDPYQPERERIHVERVEGLAPDPDGVMVMHSRVNLDPTASGYGLPVSARAKASFDGVFKDEILIRFTYLFSAGGPGVELVIYLSDVPTLLDRDDPLWDEHYLEVAHLVAPPAGRPGSPGSGRIAVFEKLVRTGHLNLAAGTWVELELIEPEPSNSVAIDCLGSAVQCYGICLDINWDNLIDVADFLKVIGECGRPAVGERACYEGVFSADGVVDALDVTSWDWALNSSDRLLNLCRVPLAGPTTKVAAASLASYSVATAHDVQVAGLPYELSDLLIVGKRGTSVPANKLRDQLYIFDRDGVYAGSSAPSPDRGNIRLVKGSAGDLYLVNSESGLVRLDETNESIVPPGALALTDVEEPRYHQPATLYVGLQEDGLDVFGRPILDAAVDMDYAYVVPVVVNPSDGEPYTAAAKLLLQPGAGTPYQVVQVYDEPPLPGDNQCRDALRELEIDGAGNLYVLNAHSLNESDILWRYAPDGTIERLDLGRPDSENYCPTPTAMYMSETTDMLYVASSRQNEDDIYTSLIHGYSTQGALTHARLIEIAGMQHVVDIAEDPATSSLWVLGFSMYYLPEYPNPTVPPFYYPCLASVGADSDRVEAQSLYDPGSHDLAFPLSIVWTGM